MMKKKKRKILLGLTAMMLQCSSTAMAKEVLHDTSVLNEVVVTATRTENKIMETASNISVLKSDDIEKMDAKTLAEVLRKLPGVYYSNASGLQPKISLRGTKIGMSGGALVLINGIPVNMGKFGYTDFSTLPVENIQRVEVVKGPMSSLYGGDSARGVINIITKRGGEKIEGTLSVSGGSHSDQRYSALAYGVNENFDYNINVKKRKQDGYRDDTSIDNNSFNGGIGYQLGNDTRLALYLQLTDGERILAKKLTKEQREENSRQAPDYSDTETTDFISGLNLEVEKQNYTIHSTIYYKNRDKLYENYKRATSTPYQEELDEDIFGARFILSMNQPILNRENTISLGVDYDHDSSDMITMKAARRSLGLPYTVKDPKKSGDFTRQELGVFIQNEFKINKSLILTAGLRWDLFQFSNNAEYDFSSGSRYSYDTEPDFDKLNPRISLNYLPKDNLSFYAGYSQSYRAPNIYDYYASGSYSAKYAYTLQPETFSQYEVGSRYRLAEWLNIDAALFHIQIEDMLDTTYDSDGNYMGKQNVSEATLKGVELGLSGSPSDWFSYNLSYTYTDARYSDTFFAKVSRTETVDVDGNRLTKTPYHQVNVDLDFTLLQRDSYQMMWNVNLFAQSEYEMDKGNTVQYDSYALMNSKLRLVHEKFEVFVAVDNIFDRDYDGYAFTSAGKEYYYPAAGRTFAAGLSYKF